MATIYFKRDLIDAAEKIIKAKGTIDRIKADNDIMLIDSVINSYYSGKGINVKYAVDLDKRLSEEYPTIDKLNKLTSPYPANGARNTLFPAEKAVGNLLTDRFGIIIDVILKEQSTDNFMAYIERIE